MQLVAAVVGLAGGPAQFMQLGVGLYGLVSQQRLAPDKPMAQVPRMSIVATPDRISAKNAVFEVPSVTAASETPKFTPITPRFEVPLNGAFVVPWLPLTVWSLSVPPSTAP